MAAFAWPSITEPRVRGSDTDETNPDKEDTMLKTIIIATLVATAAMSSAPTASAEPSKWFHQEKGDNQESGSRR